MDPESLYTKLPSSWLLSLACSLIGWGIVHTRYNRSFRKLLEEYESKSLWGRPQIEAYRDRCLRTFLRYCAEQVPYYRVRLKELGVDVKSIRGLEDLKRIPPLGKEQVQRHRGELISPFHLSSRRQIIYTSGTTGTGMQLVTTRQATRHQWAVWWRYFRWHGIQPGTWCAYFTGRSIVPAGQGRPPYWRYNYPGRQILFSGYHLGPETLPEYVAELKKRKPSWFHGYPSLLALLASYIVETGTDLDYPVSWVTIGSESLLEHQAAIIEKAFGVPPRQHYGLAEAVANISECPRGSLHVDEDFGAVEFIPNPDGPGHRIIGTNFTNPAMLLLRYDTQDVVTLSESPCPCGRPGRTVLSIDGRREDYIILNNGTRLGRMDHIFKHMVHIAEAQIYQRQPGQMLIRVVRNQGYGSEDEAVLRRETARRVGTDTRVTIEYVESLERSPTGKLRFVVSDIPQARIDGRSGHRNQDSFTSEKTCVK